MPIQFNCPACAQPIEVDDIVAGKSACCPYCSKIVQAPAASTLSEVAAARPMGGPPRDVGSDSGRSPAYPPPPPSGSRYEGAPADVQPSTGLHSARKWGTAALICTTISLVLFGIVLIQAFVTTANVLREEYGASPPTQLTTEEKIRLQESLGDEVRRSPWLAFAGMFAPALAIGGLACGARSLAHARSGNWRGYLSVGVCSMLMLCTCGSFLFNLVSSA